jgi:2-polyprenyl-3-methyl-5-hydroxy-6-metoxy-1,4-benzoquinol methylase
MKTGKKMGEGDSNYTSTPKGIFNKKRTVLFWRFVDNLACKMVKLADLYERTIGVAYRKERETFGLSKAKNILHIGCGAYPITAMILAEMNDVKIVTIDNKPKAVKLANEVISKKKLDKKIKTEYGEGIKYPLDGFDTIIVSGCSLPKIKVLEHVFKNAKPQSRIILRESYLDIKSIIDGLNPKQDITIEKKIGNHPFPTCRWESYYLVKNS